MQQEQDYGHEGADYGHDQSGQDHFGGQEDYEHDPHGQGHDGGEHDPNGHGDPNHPDANGQHGGQPGQGGDMKQLVDLIAKLLSGEMGQHPPAHPKPQHAHSRFSQDPHHHKTMNMYHKIATEDIHDSHIESFIHVGTLLLARAAHQIGMTAGHGDEDGEEEEGEDGEFGNEHGEHGEHGQGGDEHGGEHDPHGGEHDPHAGGHEQMGHC